MRLDGLPHVAYTPPVFSSLNGRLNLSGNASMAQILEGHLMPEHVHMCLAIPPKHPVASVIGFLKGKSALAIARLYGTERNFSGEHFWARGYAVSTVGFELEQVRQYIRDQGSADEHSGQF